MEKFEISVGEDVLVDLQTRLSKSRLPDQLPGTEWEYGTNKTYLVDLLAYWKDHFDWRKQERLLNSFDQFTMPVRGLKIHFVHQRSPHPNALPLLLLHGWPGSFFEFYKVIPLLTNPKDSSKAFHVIAPSLPGYGFSEAPKKRGFDVFEMAHTFNELMKLLGYEKYYAQGGDWGSIISKCIGITFPQNCLAIHVNMPLAALPPANGVGNILRLLSFYFSASKEELKKARKSPLALQGETGYMKIQETKPQTLGYGLNDSPLGLLAWIVEKFYSWSDCNGNIENSFTKDELLTNVMLYWVTQSITSSTRLYYETLGPKGTKKSFTVFCPVPTGVAMYPKELVQFPVAWLAKSYNLQHVSVMKKGGHFAALETPNELAGDIQKFFWGQVKSRL